MVDIKKTLRINALLSIYKSMLSPTQKDILTDYYNYNLSLSEIAENRHTSRAAVEDAIKKGEKKLEELESKLKVLENNQKIYHLTSLMKGNDKNKAIIDEIERIINYGI